MSWYYTYYLATRDKTTNKLYPLGPFDNKGKYYDVLCLCRDSKLYDEYEWDISKVNYDDLSDELIKALDPDGDYINRDDYDKRTMPFEVLDYDAIGSSDYIRKGYVLIEDLEQSETKDGYFDGFYGVLSPDVYAKKLENEMKFGAPKPQKDCEGEEYTPHSMADYTYHCWAEYDSAEYEASCIKRIMGVFMEYPGLPDNHEPVILISQG